MGFEQITGFFNSPIFRLFYNTSRVFVVALYFSLVYWVYRDAKRRGNNAVYWAIVVAIFNVFGLFIYLILRRPEYLDDVNEREVEMKAAMARMGAGGGSCPACGKPVEGDFLICPSCLKRLKKACPSCQRALTLSWTVCPYCQSNI